MSFLFFYCIFLFGSGWIRIMHFSFVSPFRVCALHLVGFTYRQVLIYVSLINGHYDSLVQENAPSPDSLVISQILAFIEVKWFTAKIPNNLRQFIQAKFEIYRPCMKSKRCSCRYCIKYPLVWIGKLAIVFQEIWTNQIAYTWSTWRQIDNQDATLKVFNTLGGHEKQDRG